MPDPNRCRNIGFPGDCIADRSRICTSSANFARQRQHRDIYGCRDNFLPIIAQTPTGVFRHIALSIKSGDTQLYLDGSLVATDTTAFSTIVLTSNLRIGSGYTGGRFFDGAIDEVEIYESAYSPGDSRILQCRERRTLYVTISFTDSDQYTNGHVDANQYSNIHAIQHGNSYNDTLSNTWPR